MSHTTINKRSIRSFIISVVVATISFSSCKMNDNRDFVDKEIFKGKDIETFKLEGTLMQFNDTIWHPVGIEVKDTLLFLKNRSTDYVYHIYNLKNNKKINECLKIGQGPNEFIFPLIVQSIGDNIWMFDRGTSIVKEYLVSDLLSDQVPIPQKNIQLKNHVSDKVAVLPNNNILASVNKLPRGGFDLYDFNGIFLDSIGKFPEFTSGSLSDIEKIQFFRNGFTTNLTDRIFISYLYSDLIEIYDYKGNCLRRLHGPDQFELAMSLQSVGDGFTAAKTIRGETHKCYSSPVYAGDEVFVLYFGELWEDYQERDFKIIVFDWDGNPLRMYELDTHLFTLTVDPDNRVFYGITNHPQYEIIKYDY